ncbi:methanol/ethanol family PQQ-dependent dehydrogenase [Bradyrhizobium sp. AUGA SZCCT0169]|uniref:methanol/ethanol family PQQ-dependent dehydrogenase n=1 Tax=Bradyrhizobium sp. AUGA SZCCT0169 TaxID=2807663 RepID=UPI001BA6A7DA|nr:methanol/ethanol family PQQ-dependent dehydrogenase [Bradyrhizobium sp. AUGA SZCCT0169]MBR1245335.1 methanol/ethanol family PQQ-dependent dehydrogenase [Bradyrhizobium sp. AUGA SZCCT0169]
MTTKHWLLSSSVAFTCLVSAAAGAGPIEKYSPVTSARLEKPEPGNWMLYRRTYDGQGYSPLDQINTSNVKDLTPVWTFSTGVVEGHEAPPIVNNGVMFVATPAGQVIALNAKTGDEYWRYKRQLPDDLFQLHPTNRGVGLWQDKLYLATTDDHVVALDAKTGKVLWDTKVQDYKKGQYLTLMPLIVDGKVIVGGSGGEFGVRGYVVAYDAENGKELWRTFTIPGPGEPGHETWSGDDWKSGGAPAWMTGNYDIETKTIYWGTGNAAPWPGNTHPGDNLYSTSVLALAPENGRIKTYFQYHQNDSWDWDEVEAPMLVDLQKDGRTIKSLIHPGRNAIFWVLERKADKINYVSGWPFVHTDVWKGIEPETGRPIVDPAHKPVIGKRVEFCPSLWGGKDWPSAAYSQKTGLVYVPANENFCGGFTGEKVPLVAGQLWLGTKPEDIGLKVRPGADHFGELQAWDPATGKKVWQQNFPKSQLFGSVTATAGDLVFVGGTNDRMFRAYHAKTGELLWEQKTNSGIVGMPIAYEVDGTQYIAVQSGWGVDAQRIQDALATQNNVGVENNVPQGGVVWVFAVKK